MSVQPAARRAAHAAALALVVVSAWAVPAVATAQSQTPPPEPRISRGYPVWMGYMIGAVLVGAVVLISLMPSKRAHTD